MGGVVGIFATLTGAVYFFVRHDTTYNSVIDVLRVERWRERHSRAVDWLLGKAAGFYGPRLMGPQAFAACLVLAFCYPVFAYFLGWVMGGPAVIVPGLAISETASTGARLIVFGTLIAIGLL